MNCMTRAELVSLGLRGGVGILAGTAVLAAASPALAGEQLDEGDLATVRLAASAELLAIDFYTRAIASNRLDRQGRTYLREARGNEQDHYAALAAVLGDTAPVSDDFAFVYAKKTFASSLSIAKTAVTLEMSFVGAYLGAVSSLLSGALRVVAAQIAASEARHLSLASQLSSGTPIGPSFPKGLDIQQATDALAAFLGE
jgi:hypothetical protein